jgi:hypothetical protein
MAFFEFGEQFGEQTGFFLAQKRKKVFVFKDWRGGRVVECGGLENR